MTPFRKWVSSNLPKKTNNPNPSPTGKNWFGLYCFGAGNRTRTCTRWQWNLNPPSLPIPPCPQICLLQQEYPNTKRAVCQCRLAARRRAKLLFWNTPTRAIMPMTIPRNSPVDWRVDVLWRWQAKMIAMITRQNRSLMISLKAYILLTVPLCADFPFTIPHCLPKNILFVKKHCLSSASDNGSHESDVVSEGKSVCFS